MAVNTTSKNKKTKKSQVLKQKSVKTNRRRSMKNTFHGRSKATYGFLLLCGAGLAEYAFNFTGLFA